MGFRRSSDVDAPLAEVFAWHARPGASRRLTPPWQPVHVVAEADSLRDGRAVLGLPGGLRWVARHQPDGYVPERQFVDQLVGPLAAIVPWRHTHLFEAVTPDTTRMTDSVDTRVPDAVLRSMFDYRHAQLAADLAANARATAWRAQPVTVAVTGSGGLVGSALTASLATAGHRVIRLVRRPIRASDERRWRPDDPDRDLLAGVDAVVHLAGAGIAGRFTDRHLADVRHSRIGPTKRLAERAAATHDGPTVFVSASAVGYYGPDRGDEILTEDSERGDGPLADLVADWEAAASGTGLRGVRVRTGIVQSPRGGVLRLQYPLFLAGLGGPLGDGRHWLPWIDIDDLTDVYVRAILDAAVSGPVNAVAPQPVRNGDYTRVLAGVLHRPALLTVPRPAVQLALGESGARELAFATQRVRPERLTRLDHHFRHPELEGALRHLLG
ncbi:MAG TPA: TIGR01777 family oxidoreductase [Pseudonocardiaceae bacterium]|jgi:hypothetical protein